MDASNTMEELTDSTTYGTVAEQTKRHIGVTDRTNTRACWSERNNDAKRSTP